jgi:hypothetical protein
MNSHKRRLHTGAKAHAGLERLLGINGASLTWCWCQAGAPPCLIDQPGARGYYSPMWLLVGTARGDTPGVPQALRVRGQTCAEATRNPPQAGQHPQQRERAQRDSIIHRTDHTSVLASTCPLARSHKVIISLRREVALAIAARTWGAKSMCVLSTSRSRMPLP